MNAKFGPTMSIQNKKQQIIIYKHHKHEINKTLISCKLQLCNHFLPRFGLILLAFAQGVCAKWPCSLGQKGPRAKNGADVFRSF